MRALVLLSVSDVPRVPIYQPLLDVTMQKNIKGYQYWFHRYLDYRQLEKSDASSVAQNQKS